MNSDPTLRLRLAIAMKLGVPPSVVDEMDFEDALGIAQLCREDAEAMKASGGGSTGKIVTRFRGV
jgi:hypothetical protein